MPEFEFRTLPLQHTAVVRVTTTTDRIGEAMGRALPAAFAAVERAGVQPAGPPFCKYLSWGETEVVFEAGVPVPAPFAGEADVRPGEVGGCEAAVATHVGSYETLGQTYGKLQAWIETQGRKPAGVMWESYLTDPGSQPDPSTWRTEVYWPAV